MTSKSQKKKRTNLILLNVGKAPLSLGEALTAGLC